MSFRRFGGINYAASNNIVRSNYANNNNVNIQNRSGLPNSREVFRSHIDMADNSLLNVGSIYFADGTSQSSANSGANGPQGPQGADGAAGPQGADGATGPAGADGATGPQGADGATGPQGADGAAASVGSTGPAGVDGATGPAGADGATGPAGQDGATGPAGADGVTGPAGPQGAQGVTGPAGPTTLSNIYANSYSNGTVSYTSSGNDIVTTTQSYNTAGSTTFSNAPLQIYQATVSANFDGVITISTPIQMNIPEATIKTTTETPTVTTTIAISDVKFYIYKDSVLFLTISADASSGSVTSVTINVNANVFTDASYSINTYLGNFSCSFTPTNQTSSATYNIEIGSNITTTRSISSSGTISWKSRFKYNGTEITTSGTLGSGLTIYGTPVPGGVYAAVTISNTNVFADGCSALGYTASNGGFILSTAIGYGATNTASNQIVLGTTGQTINIVGTLVNGYDSGNQNWGYQSSSLGSNNSSFGYNAFYTNNSGTNNTAFGYRALYYGFSGNYNTALGNNAGYNNESGSYNTFVGYNSKLNDLEDPWTNSTALGSGATISASNQIVLGTSSETVSIPGSATVTGSVTAASFTVSSDYRIKENIQELDINTYNVNDLKPVIYDNKKTQIMDIGFIAHEVQEYFPFLVRGNKDDKEHQSLNYNGMIGILVKEIQELKRRVTELENIK